MEDQIIKDIQRVHATHGKVTRDLYDASNPKFSRFTVNRIFGSWGKAIIAAGLQPTRKNYTDQEIIQELQRFYEETKSSHSDDFRVRGRVSLAAVERHFGSWSRALLVAKLPISRIHNVSKDEMSSSLQLAAAKTNEPLTVDNYNALGMRYCAATIAAKFGGWHEALLYAGLPPHENGKRFSDKQILNRIATEPLSASLNTNNSLYYKRFPGKRWPEILEMAGVDVDKRTLGKDGRFYDSIEEMSIADVLYSNFIQYEPHKLICDDRKWRCDFYLPPQFGLSQECWVEYDGLKDRRPNKEKFAAKLDFYQTFGLPYLLLVDTKNTLQALNLIVEHKYEFEYRAIDHKTANEFLDRVHYLGAGSRPDRYRVGVYFKELLVGVVTFGKTANPRESSLALTRFAILDRIRCFHPFNNTSSHIMSRALRWLKKQGYRGKIVSWSDPRQHDGVLYKACNFRQVETSQSRDYVYVDADGREYHKSRCRVPAGQSEPEYARRLGLWRVDVPPKTKWEIGI